MTLQWVVTHDEYGNRFYLTSGERGTYVINGNNPGKMRWNLRHPDGSVSICDTLAECKAMAEQAHRY